MRTRELLPGALAEYGTVSRAELSRLTGLSRSGLDITMREPGGHLIGAAVPDRSLLGGRTFSRFLRQVYRRNRETRYGTLWHPVACGAGWCYLVVVVLLCTWAVRYCCVFVWVKALFVVRVKLTVVVAPFWIRAIFISGV